MDLTSAPPDPNADSTNRVPPLVTQTQNGEDVFASPPPSPTPVRFRNGLPPEAMQQDSDDEDDIFFRDGTGAVIEDSDLLDEGQFRIRQTAITSNPNLSQADRLEQLNVLYDRQKRAAERVVAANATIPRRQPKNISGGSARTRPYRPNPFGRNFSGVSDAYRNRGNITIPNQVNPTASTSGMQDGNTNTAGSTNTSASGNANTNPAGLSNEQLNYINYVTSYLSRIGVTFTAPLRFNFTIPTNYSDIENALTTGTTISVDTLKVLGRYLGINNIDSYTDVQLGNIITSGQIANFLKKNICGNTRFQDTTPIASDLAGRYKLQLQAIIDSNREGCFDKCIIPHLEVLGLERDENICTNLVPLCNFHMSYLFGLKLESISLNSILSLVNCITEDPRNNTNILVLKAHEGFFQGRAYDIGPMSNRKFETVLENNVKALQLDSFNNPAALHDLTFILTVLRLVSTLMKSRDPAAFIRANIDDFVESIIESPDAAEIFNVAGCIIQWHKRVNAGRNAGGFRSLLTYIVGEFSIQNRIQNISLDVNVDLNNFPKLNISPNDTQIPIVTQPITQDDLIVVAGTVTFEMLRLRGTSGSDRILNYQEFKPPIIKCERPPTRQTNPLIVSTNRATFK